MGPHGGEILKDKCGHEITQGCVVDVFVCDMLSAYCVEVKEGGLIGPDGQPEPATLILNIALPIKLRPGAVAPCYVVRERVKKAEEEEKQEERVM